MKRFMGLLCWVVASMTTDLGATLAQAQSPVYSMVKPVVPSIVMPKQRAIAWHNNLDSGWRESKRTGRPMVIFITASRCRYCDAMKDVTWRDNGVENRVGNEFVAVQLSPEHNPSELSRITVDVYPTTLIAAPHGKVIEHRKGFQPPELLHELLNRATFRR